MMRRACSPGARIDTFERLMPASAGPARYVTRTPVSDPLDGPLDYGDTIKSIHFPARATQS